MRGIESIRCDINKVDQAITELFEKRMNLSAEVKEYKEKNNLPVLNASREEEVLKKAVLNLENKGFEEYTKELFKKIMSLSRKYQNSIGADVISIGFQGIDGSFSHEACFEYIRQNRNSYSVKSYETFDELCLALLNDEIKAAVIPLENSSTGAVADVYDLLLKYDYKIAGEICLRVNHCLLAKKGTDFKNIEEVYSHQQAFMQSKEFLDNYDFKLIPYKNTAISAKYVSESEKSNIACIAGEAAAKIYGLTVLKKNINYNQNNFTRFVVLSKNENTQTDGDKISIITKLKNTPGQLYMLTKLFYENNVNMLKIESRPDLGNPFEYIFYIDISGNADDKNIKNVISEIKENCSYFKCLGNYKSSNIGD